MPVMLCQQPANGAVEIQLKIAMVPELKFVTMQHSLRHPRLLTMHQKKPAHAANIVEYALARTIEGFRSRLFKTT